MEPTILEYQWGSLWLSVVEQPMDLVMEYALWIWIQVSCVTVIAQLQAQGIKENFIQLLVSQSGQLFAQK